MTGDKMSDAEWKLRAHAAINGLPQPKGPIYREEAKPDPDAKMRAGFKWVVMTAGALMFAWLANAQFQRETEHWVPANAKPRYDTPAAALQGR